MQTKDVPIGEVLRAVAAFWAAPPGQGQTPEVALASRWPPKLVMARMERLVARGELEYGVSLRTAWLTEKGKHHLAALAVLGG